ncbi:type I polyketide synthase [Alkalimonas amylolytica]|uniref:Acyl transferase domain-containing protein n=1 Tax=Alkalimonas amylolytica TaxID=152573 RepID=A0A1H4G2R4_ALKAM|nr:type I polyketide synthase [Alkalimonas amylolytica]SEB03893.1 Acyl transferase domain-containing protein [Alkalimonas amylolytica]
MQSEPAYQGTEIAIIGMAGQFPSAPSIDEFWQLLLQERSGISHFSEEQLAAAGISTTQLQDPAYVRSKGVLADSLAFDASFFQYSDREAVLMDPQLRLYHQTAWQALEDAGYAGLVPPGSLVGVFGGASANPLWTAQYSQVATEGGAAAYEVLNLISRDFFNSRLAYKLDLKGPAVTIQSACSTGLVAVHQACQSLLSGDTDLALAGAVSLSTNPALQQPEMQGYLYQEGMILAPDGICRPFSADAQGTVLSDGVAFVALRRLQDAIEAGDQIYAVIKGSAVNNDGQDKVGFTAPGVRGQQQVLQTALQLAGVSADSIGYIEAHGTGTLLGDPIETEALQRVYGKNRSSSCMIGSVKSNIGHLDTAAGLAGFIKTTLALHHQKIPASLNFTEANPKCQFSANGLQVAASTQDWLAAGLRRAAVSSFGIGGTNAHVILEQYKPNTKTSAGGAVQTLPLLQLLPVSAHSVTALSAQLDGLKAQLKSSIAVPADMAFSLSHRRKRFAYRAALICNNQGQVLAETATYKAATGPLYWLFSGQGSQYPQMAAGLYQQLPEFRSVAEQCCSLIRQQQGPDVAALLWSEASQSVSRQDLRATDLAQICLFVVEYCLARTMLAYGLKPEGMIGHSLGEYVAACLAGVFSLEDAIKLVLARSQLMAGTAAGSMLAVHASAEQLDLQPWPELAVAAFNSPEDFVISGPTEQIQSCQSWLQQQGIAYTALDTSHAFHSAMMDPVLPEFAKVLATVTLHSPQIPFVSNLTGEWAEAEQVCRPDYWLAHLRQAVRFSDGIGLLLQQPDAVLVEVGPGKTLAGLATKHPAFQRQQALSCLRGSRGQGDDLHGFYQLLGQCYSLGQELEWQQLQTPGAHYCQLPPYTFDKKIYLPQFRGFASQAETQHEGFYQQRWHSCEFSDYLSGPSTPEDAGSLLWFRSLDPAEHLLEQQLRQSGRSVIEVVAASQFGRHPTGYYQLDPEQPEHYQQLLQELIRQELIPRTILLNWQARTTAQRYQPFAALFLLAKSMAQLATEPVACLALTEGACRVSGDEPVNPDAALVYGPLRVISQEFPNWSCHQLDIREGQLPQQSAHIVQLLSSATFITTDNASGNVVLPLQSALRGNWLWQPDFQLSGVASVQPETVLRSGGVYLLTGGLGGAGAVLARYLASQYQARLILCSRQAHADHPLLAELRALGSEVIAVAADLRQPAAVQLLLDSALSTFGTLNGVFHLAGVPGEQMLLRHELDRAKAVIETKIACANALVELCQQQNLDFLVLFSSVTAVLGGMGQLDYCAANAALDAVAQMAHSKGIHQVRSIRWDAWRDAGMAVDALNGKLQRLKTRVHPLLGDLILQQDEQCVYRTTFNADLDWPLAEHWVMGVPTVPGTTYLQLAAAAWQQQTGQLAVKFDEVYFLSGLALPSGQTADLYTSLEQVNGNWQFEVASFQPELQQYQLHARGLLSQPMPPESFSGLEVGPIQRRLDQRVLTEINGAADLGAQAMSVQMSASEQDELMKYGPRWDCFDSVWIGQSEGLARLVLPAAVAADVNDLTLHPALLDCAVSFLRAFIDGGVYIPISYHSLNQYQPLPARFYSYVRLTPGKHADGVLSFELELFDEQGQLLAQARGFTMRRIEAALQMQASAAALPLPSYVYRHQKMLQGIDNNTAMQVLENVLRQPAALSLYAVSDFSSRYAKAADGETGLFGDVVAEQGPQRPRPELDSAYVPARTPAQQQLAELWQQLLGLEKVGIQDDFFALGGDSLLLMQAHKKIQQMFSTKLPVVELYNYPTIQRLAEFMDKDHSPTQDKALSAVSARIDKKKAAAARRRQLT